MQQAQRLAGIGSWTWNLKDNSFDFSEELSHLYGIEKKEISSLEDILAKFIHPDDRETVFGAAGKVFNDGYGGPLVYRVIKPDGEIRWMNATIPEVRYFDVDGNPEVMVGAVQDITERKRDEQRLREREERWKIFSESATDVFTIWDSKLNLIDNSEKGISAFFPPETGKDDLIGKNITEFLPDEEREGRYRKYLNVIKTGKPYLVDDLVPHHRFGDRRVSIKAFKVGEGLGTIVTDITEQKNAEHKLKESEARLRAFMESSTDIYAIFDSQLRLIEVSDRGVKAFLPDKTREEQIGKHISEIVPEVMETGRYEEFLKVLETGKPFSVEEAIIHPRYAIRHISIKSFKVQEGIGMIFSDITARKNAEQELRYYSERIRAMAKQLSEMEESQRRSISRELHDNVGQNLTVLGINFSRAKTQIAKAKIEEVQFILDDSQQLLEQTTESIRNVMADLRPPVLEDYGLLAALRWYGNLFSSRNKISTTVQGEEPDPRMGIDIEIVLFRITQEALTNIAKHAKASNVTMNFDIKDGRQRLVITDDGVGFDTGELYNYKEQTSWGMVTMFERAQSIGGSLFIESHPGGGTKIVVEVPK
jgi:PAS domain S-box-containing protein